MRSRAADKPAVASQSGSDDALAWLKIIQNATGDLTADLHASKGDDFGHSFADKTASFESTPPSGIAAPVRRREDFNEENRHEDYESERQLAQKLSYRYAEPRQAPPQTLGAAVLPYVAATGVLAFLAGSAAVYFLMGSSSTDVKARAVAPALETQIEAPLVHPTSLARRKVVSSGRWLPVFQATAQPSRVRKRASWAPSRPNDHSKVVRHRRDFQAVR